MRYAQQSKMTPMSESVKPQLLATFNQRDLAHIVDALISCAGYMLAYLLMLNTSKNQQVIALLLFIILWFFFYVPGLESSHQQATLGQRLVRLKVVDVDGRRLTYSRAFKRQMTLGMYMGFRNRIWHPKAWEGCAEQGIRPWDRDTNTYVIKA